jgi:hypothetical protein
VHGVWSANRPAVIQREANREARQNEKQKDRILVLVRDKTGEPEEFSRKILQALKFGAEDHKDMVPDDNGCCEAAERVQRSDPR